MRGSLENLDFNRIVAMLPVGLFGFMLPKILEMVIYADPPKNKSKDVSCLMGTCKSALRNRSQEATVGGWLKSARQSGSSDGLRVCVI